MGRLNGKVALVTGAAMGIGAAIAKLFAQEGAEVIATDLQVDVLNQTVDNINNYGGQAIAVSHNVSVKEDWENVVAEGLKHYGKIDILVNNAGILRSTPFAETTVELWNNVMTVNALGTFLGMQTVAPVMRKNGRGSIVNIASMVSIIGFSLSAYAASKGAVRTLSKAAAVNFGKDNIRVNSVYPGVIRTPMMNDHITDQFDALIQAQTPLLRLGEPEDIAPGVLYLASDESSFVTGMELVIDGGFVAR